MNHLKTLALGTALLLTATVETQAGCVPCPTGQISFGFYNKACTPSTFTDSQTGTGKWNASAAPCTTAFTADLSTYTATLKSVTAGMTECVYTSPSQPQVTLYRFVSSNPGTSCSTLNCPPKEFSCTAASENKK